MGNMERPSIGDLARATGLTVRALRHDQDLGLLAPELDRLIGPGHERRNLGFDEAGIVLPA